MKCTLPFILALGGFAACGKSNDSKAAPGVGANHGKPSNAVVGGDGSAGASATSGLAQKVSTSSMFLGATDADFFTSFELSKGRVRKGATIDGVDGAGHRMSFTVVRIQVDSAEGSKVDAEQLGPGQYGSLDLRLVKGSMREFGGDFFLVDAGAAPPQAELAAAQAAASAADAARGTITCTVDGKPWLARPVATGAGFYRNGLKIMNGGGKPYFMMAFVAAAPPDDRQLTIVLNDWTPQTGAVPRKFLEASLNGSAVGDKKNPIWLGIKNHPDYKNATFDLKVTKWQVDSPTRVTMDGAFDAVLTGVIATKQPPATFACTISSLAVSVYEQSQ